MQNKSTNLYITATEERSGKSAIVLGVMQMLLKQIEDVAFFGPLLMKQNRAGKIMISA